MTIEGVQVIPLRRIPDERGTIFHMLRADDPHFTEFGEIYFASVYEGVVKAWHLHRLMTLNYACVHGRVKVACYDDRARVADPRQPDGGLPRPGQLLPGRDPARDLERAQGDGPRALDHRQLRDPSPRSRRSRSDSTRSTTRSRTTGMSVTAESRRRVTVGDRPDRTLLVFHAERLHDDAVWRRVLPIATALAADGIRLTFFVFPYRAEAVGADLAPRVRELGELGHEIAQHTHFYAGKSFLTEQKFDDLSDANVVACLERDADTLRVMGVEPRGFTAGAWQAAGGGIGGVARPGFEYDCSARHPQPGVQAPQRAPSVARRSRVYSGDAGRLAPASDDLQPWRLVQVEAQDAGRPDRLTTRWSICTITTYSQPHAADARRRS